MARFDEADKMILYGMLAYLIFRELDNFQPYTFWHVYLFAWGCATVAMAATSGLSWFTGYMAGRF